MNDPPTEKDWVEHWCRIGPLLEKGSPTTSTASGGSDDRPKDDTAC